VLLNEYIHGLSVLIECLDNKFQLLPNPTFPLLAPFSGLLSFFYKKGQWRESLRALAGIRYSNICMGRGIVYCAAGRDNSYYCGGTASSGQYLLALIRGEFVVENLNGSSPSRGNSGWLSLMSPEMPSRQRAARHQQRNSTGGRIECCHQRERRKLFTYLAATDDSDPPGLSSAARQPLSLWAISELINAT
jgi:hypothetical protein